MIADHGIVMPKYVGVKVNIRSYILYAFGWQRKRKY
jgi:hypothetical protein